MMIHPGTKAMTTRTTLASNKVKFEFFGKPAHAAAAPDLGINALDACIQTFNNINALRQHHLPCSEEPIDTSCLRVRRRIFCSA